MDKIKKIIEWTKLKVRIEFDSEKKKYFDKREIWWLSLGANIGHEEDGKNDKHERPVLVLKKFNKNLFWGLPLSSKNKKNKYYSSFVYRTKKKEKEGVVILSQIKTISSKRLSRKIGKVQVEEFNKIRELIKKLI